MYPTTEIRWFYEGEIPSAMSTAFHQKGKEPEFQPPRTDYYLSLPGKSDLGIKVREGALEIKKRTVDFGNYQFTSYAMGRIESWVKWRFELSSTLSDIVDDFENSNGWIPIRKKRFLRHCRLTSSGDLIESPFGTEFDCGCEWEISEIQINQEPNKWWSMAFEFFGSMGDQPEKLVEVVKIVLLDFGFWTFSELDSMSYPQWLLEIQNIL